MAVSLLCKVNHFVNTCLSYMPKAKKVKHATTVALCTACRVSYTRVGHKTSVLVGFYKNVCVAQSIKNCQILEVGIKYLLR